MSLEASELILNSDGSIYHLNLLPEDLAETVIVVGDPDRVGMVSKYFDLVQVKKGKREFITHTGILNGKRVSVVSTGIGSDNIDIVFNELDALVNIDLKTRTIKQQHKALDIVRIGTSGGIQPDIAVDSFLLSQSGVGFDGLLHFYDGKKDENQTLCEALTKHLKWHGKNIVPYVFDNSAVLAKKLISNRIRFGVTVTNAGFYGPQGRQLRLNPSLLDFHEKLLGFRMGELQITNLEMETAAIYGLAKLLGHHAVSMNAILANRATGEFSKDPTKTVDALIQYCLERLT
ncbi:nucleoside phosphorylase [uncultured Croceitalea sp.]|uniref:nucleoside phosphorylase n=1 Tax=uncultured Croceitalea sp. TaxID=1798908 RepID=UPI00330576EA